MVRLRSVFRPAPARASAGAPDLGAVAPRGAATRGSAVVTMAVALALALTQLGCAGAPRVREQAEVRFQLDPPTARVYVEDRFLGAGRVLSRRPRTFPPGPRHFTITADGYFPHDVEVDLPSGVTTIRLRLRPVPP